MHARYVARRLAEKPPNESSFIRPLSAGPAGLPGPEGVEGLTGPQGSIGPPGKLAIVFTLAYYYGTHFGHYRVVKGCLPHLQVFKACTLEKVCSTLKQHTHRVKGFKFQICRSHWLSSAACLA